MILHAQRLYILNYFLDENQATRTKKGIYN